MNQHWDPDTYAKHARYVSDLGADLIELLDPKPGERVLDLGCGDGALTVRLAARGCSIVGIDSSPDQVAAARARGLDARVGRAEALEFHEEFDGVFSNAVLHWVRDSQGVAWSVHRALEPGGRFVGELGGAGNVQAIRSALHAALVRRGIDPAAVDPWTYPSEDEYRDALERAGFDVRLMVLFPRPTPLPTGMDGWLYMFAQPFVAAVGPGEAQGFVREVIEAVRPSLHDAERGWFADYVRLRFLAVRRPSSDHR